MYEGDWKGNYRTGFGVLKLPFKSSADYADFDGSDPSKVGAMYIGEWESDVRHGLGVFRDNEAGTTFEVGSYVR
jgi:hypothetical protein